MSIQLFQKLKQADQKITMVTCYDYWSATILNVTQIDTILVGDSASMVMHGASSTLGATITMMVEHTASVARGAPDKFIIGDLPFCSYRKSLAQTMEAVEAIMRAGAHAVKLEGAGSNIPTIQHIIESGIPVMGHLGLTPQSVHHLGGFKVQGGNPEHAARIVEEAQALADAGCFSIVLECVPYELAQKITEQISIPTIGIGAGPYTSGQVLVLHDLLGLTQSFKPKFLKNYLNGFDLIRDAVNSFDSEVKESVYPNLKEHSYA